MRRVWLWWGLIVCSAVVLQAWALWGERWGVAANGPSGPNWPVGEVAEGITAEQTFVMQAQGLRSFTLTPRAVGATVAGDVVFDVFDVTPEGDRPLFRIRKKGTSVVRGGRAYTLEFPAIDLPTPRTFKVRIALPGARFGEGFFLDGVEHDRYLGGVLVVNHKEVWGDLVFETDAVAARLVARLGAVGRPYPPALRSAPVVIGLVVALNALLAWVVWVALARPDDPERAGDPNVPEPVRDGVGVRSWRWLTANRAFAVALILVLAVAVVGLSSQRERVLVDLAASFPSADKRTSMRTLHEGFALSDLPTVGVVEPCILALPSSRITWTVEVPPGAMLSVRAGLRPDAWEQGGDGAMFRVGVADGQGYRELRRLYLNPFAEYRDRAYQLLRFDLSRFSGQRLNIVLSTDPGLSQNGVNDAALWCAPRLVAR